MTAAYARLLEALYAQNQFAMKYDLDAMRQVVSREGLERPAEQVAIVAGTNGKGTISATLNAIAMRHGWRVGVFTSPHLVDFRERIRINGEPISREDAVRIGEDVFETYAGRSPLEDCDVADPSGRRRRSVAPAEVRPLSYFELTTVMALRAFAEADLDLVILEVGLGGRLDATNALDADVAVFGSIAMDHQAYLGDTLEAIAAEKAAVARAGRPAILHAANGGHAELRAALEAREADVAVVDGGASPREWNRALATSAFEALAGDAHAVERAWILEGIDGVRWPGRQEIRHVDGTTYWVDGAHNEESMAAWAGWIDTLGAPEVTIVGLSPPRTPELLGPVVARSKRIVVTQAIHAKAVVADEVADGLRAMGAEGVEVATDPGDALRRARSAAEGGPIAIVGSLYLVGELYGALGLTAEDLAIVDHGMGSLALA